MSTVVKPNHIGRKISRIRELRDMKQEALALALGVSQQTVSAMENKETIERDLLEQVAKILGVTPEAIENFSEEAVLNIISNTFNSNDTSTLNAINYHCTFNPIDKIVELYDEKVALLERLLQSEREKTEILKNSKG